MTLSVYVLRLVRSKWYVGTSSDPNRRIQAHREGRASAWTKMHPPRSRECEMILGPFESAIEARIMEDAQVKRLMVLHGINRVRGGTYSGITLSPENIITLNLEIRHAYNACMRCGETGHYARSCTATHSVDGEQLKPKQPVKCYRCGRASHSTRDCYAGTHRNGILLI